MKIDSEFVNHVKELAQQAAIFIRSNLGNVVHEQIITKDLNSLVSFVDTGSEKILVSGLKKLLPNSGFLTEEGTVQRVANEVTWIIDPLDGTTNFLHNIPSFAISIALQVRQEIIFGLVLEVNRNECFYAVKNQGAFLNQKRIYINQGSFSESLIATGFPYYDFSKTKPYLKVLEELMRCTRGVRRLGAAAVDLAYVACGKFNGFYEYGLAPWDVAAGAIIVQESGGFVSDFSGNQNWLFGRSIIAGSVEVHQQLQNIITDKFEGDLDFSVE